MDFSLTDEQEIASREAIRFAREELNPHYLPDSTEFPKSLFRKFGEFGCLGAMVPAELGGIGENGTTTAVIFEALGYACDDHGLLHAAVTQMLCATTIAERYLWSLAPQRQKIFTAPGMWMSQNDPQRRIVS